MPISFALFILYLINRFYLTSCKKIYNLQRISTLAFVSSSCSKATQVGCPRNNQFFFGSNRNKPKLNLFQLFLGLFRETKRHFFSLFRFVSVFLTGIETTKTNRILSKYTETNRKNLQNNVLYQGVLETVFFFSVRTETHQNSTCFGCFWFAFSQNQEILFPVCFDVLDRYRNNRNNSTYGMGN